jgi:aryl-alcohol dehydrogenase-like predicted oxidoreductase
MTLGKWSLWTRDLEEEIVDAARELGIGIGIGIGIGQRYRNVRAGYGESPEKVA